MQSISDRRVNVMTWHRAHGEPAVYVPQTTHPHDVACRRLWDCRARDVLGAIYSHSLHPGHVGRMWGREAATAGSGSPSMAWRHHRLAALHFSSIFTHIRSAVRPTASYKRALATTCYPQCDNSMPPPVSSASLAEPCVCACRHSQRLTDAHAPRPVPRALGRPYITAL